MQQLLNFFFKNRTLILFLFLLSISFGLTINSQDYQKSKFINSSAWVSGSIHALFSDIGDYFYLKKENELLLEENNRLKSREYSLSIAPSETLNLKKDYKLTPATVVK
ncbi:MAG: rod shape-determining protein MreC, partial [Bacteroidota bacterium]|nr:rod shape-determining protein MreC [Bacteroidota bacterium]